VIGDVGMKVSLKYDPLETINFYGLGNDSRRNAELESADYYRVFFQQAFVQSSFFKPVSAVSEVTLSAAVQRFKTDLEWKDTSYIKEDMQYGVNIENLLEISAGFSLDSRDERKFPTRGLYLDVGCAHFPAIWSNKNDFTRCGAECRIYLSPVRDVILAFRVGGEKIWGIFPFYEAVFLGGLSSVRAFRDERFGGDTAVRGGAELRFKVFRPKVFVPMDTGLFAFADGGRVWVDENSPGDWHNGAGGGIWFAPIYRAFTFSIGMAFAGEGSRLYLNGGFAF
jgi:outer membrane protein assembly factor BamA